jgi:hypothetical protein
MQTMTLDQFRAAFQAGGLRSIGVKADGARFFVTAEPRSGETITLATTRGRTARGFRDPGKAIAVLHEIGARTIAIDTSGWSPEKAAQEARRRPDTAERQRRAHEAAAHDAWFRAEVRQAIREADDPNAVWISQEDVERESAEREAAWLAQAARG